MKGAYKFRPSARLIRTIGDDIIKDVYAAVIELIKNAYDADAEVVTLTRVSDFTITAADVAISGANALVVRQTVPTVATVRGGTTFLRGGENHVMTVTVTADAKGDVILEQLGVFATTTATPTTTIDRIIVREAGDPDILGVTTTPATAMGTSTAITITPQTIAAGTSKTFEIFVDITVASDGSWITTRLTEENFQWEDVAGGTANIPGALVEDLPSASFTLSWD